jgi:ubiquinone/menaquinone biosynthesis C-methylase UbiE
MAISKLVANQLGNPTGIFSKLAALIWNRRNAALNDTVFDLLELEPTDRVLDIGFGGGYLLYRMAKRVTNGCIAGVDISPAMVADAQKRYQTIIRSGKLELKCGSVEALPYPDQHFTKASSINSIFYWQNIEKGLSEMQRVLEKKGKAVVCFTEKGSIEKKGFAKEIKLFEGGDIDEMLKESGFCDTEVLSFVDQYRQFTCIIARRF